MYKIGEFARITRVTAKALRLYDEMGILRPFQTDPISGYRYYSADQMAELDKVMALKDSGFSLVEIAAIQSGQWATPKGLVTLLEGRIMELERDVQTSMERVSRIRSRISALLKEGVTHMLDITIKNLEPMLIASLRKRVADFSGGTLGPIWRELNNYIDANEGKKVVPCMMLLHNDGEDGLWDISVVEPIARPIPEGDNVKVTELQAVQRMACAIHKGPYASLGDTYREFTEWMNSNGYEMTMPIRELYH